MIIQSYGTHLTSTVLDCWKTGNCTGCCMLILSSRQCLRTIPPSSTLKQRICTIRVGLPLQGHVVAPAHTSVRPAPAVSCSAPRADQDAASESRTSRTALVDPDPAAHGCPNYGWCCPRNLGSRCPRNAPASCCWCSCLHPRRANLRNATGYHDCLLVTLVQE